MTVADEIGKRIANKSNAEIEQIAYKSWFDIEPSKSITQYDSQLKTSVAFQKFTSDEWVNTINNAVNETRKNNSLTNDITNTIAVENNKEFLTQSYQYEKSDNAKINNLREDASKYFDNSKESHAYIDMLEKIITDKDIDIFLSKRPMLSIQLSDGYSIDYYREEELFVESRRRVYKDLITFIETYM